MHPATLVVPKHQPEQRDDRCHGEKNLLSAVLYDALVVLSHPHCRGVENKERLAETRIWLASDSQHPFSFLWICAHLNLAAHKIRYEIIYGNFTKKTRRRRFGQNVKKTLSLALAA